MKIKKISILGIGGIDNLDIEFNDNLNLICGANGIGKTTVLECIAHSFGGYSSYNILRRKAGYEEGKVKISIESDGRLVSKEFIKKNFHPQDQLQVPGTIDYKIIGNKIINIKTNRDINYQKLNSVKGDTLKDEHVLREEANHGIKIIDLKDWFVNRVMWSAHEDLLTEEQQSNLELAKKVFQYLDPSTEYKGVNHRTFDILVKNRGEEIYLEYLSSGYKSALYILLGIIKEIEFRFVNENKIKAEDYDGIILIDEIELHLHPKWQANLVLALKNIFSKSQIIATTHSPTIIQIAESKEVVALVLDENLKVVKKEIEEEYSFKGWTIEEVLEDVMGLESLRSKEYLEYIKDFDKAIDEEDKNKAIEIYNKLKQILHPKNPMLKLLNLDLTIFGGIEEKC